MPGYEELTTQQGPTFLRRKSKEDVASADSFVFDCDGVLIDVRKSYDATIGVAVDWLVRRLFGLALPWKELSLPLIQGLRNAGQFNNDWDSVYAICLFTACSLPDARAEKFSPDWEERSPRYEKPSRAEAARLLRRVRRMVDSLSRSPTNSGATSASDAVWGSLPGSKLGLCERVKGALGYPGNPPTSLLASLFDEVYHGAALYREMYSAEPRYYQGRGLIERDRVVVRPTDLESLSSATNGRLAIVTGRPRRAAEYSLGGILSYFVLRASMFIGDGDISPSPEADSFRKPSGKGLLWARERLGSRKLVYVGDSAEDLQMVKNARESADGLAFAGIYGSSYQPAEQLRFFKQQGAELILPSVKAMAGVMKEVAAR